MDNKLWGALGKLVIEKNPCLLSYNSLKGIWGKTFVKNIMLNLKAKKQNKTGDP